MQALSQLVKSLIAQDRGVPVGIREGGEVNLKLLSCSLLRELDRILDFFKTSLKSFLVQVILGVLDLLHHFWQSVLLLALLLYDFRNIHTSLDIGSAL